MEERVRELVHMRSVSSLPSAAATDRDFEEFFASEHRALMRFCWGLTVDPHEATDVAQETMARAYRNWEQLRSGNPAGWTRSVALNLVRTRWRSSQRREQALDRLREVTPVGSVDRQPVSAEVVAALSSLSERQRESVVLHHMCDLPVAEVAAHLGLSEASVKTHLQRGRASLAHLLDPAGALAQPSPEPDSSPDGSDSDA